MYITVQDQEYLALARECVEATFEMNRMTEGWKHETGKDLQKGIVHSQYMSRYGRKVFRLQVGLMKIDGIYREN